MAIAKDQVRPESTSMEEPLPSSSTTTKRGPGRTRKTVSVEQQLEVFGQATHDLARHISLTIHDMRERGAVVVVLHGVYMCPKCERLMVIGRECGYCAVLVESTGTTGKAA